MYSIVYSRQFYYQFTPHIKFKRSLLNTNQVGLLETLVQKPHILLSLTNSIVLRLTSRLLYTSPLKHCDYNSHRSTQHPPSLSFYSSRLTSRLAQFLSPLFKIFIVSTIFLLRLYSHCFAFRRTPFIVIRLHSRHPSFVLVNYSHL